MDNQQERLVSLDFVAGLMVGEGSFTLAVNPQYNNRGLINPTFHLFMTDRDTIESVYVTLKHHVLPGYFETRAKKPPNKEQYGIRAGGVKSIKRLCEVFIPLLTGDKKQAAEIVSEYAERRLALGRGAPYDDTDIEFVRRIRQVNSGRLSHKYPVDQLPRILRDYTPCPSD